jgi:hypothetical protein
LFLGVDHIQLALRGQQFSLGAVALGLGRLERGVGRWALSTETALVVTSFL